MPVRWIQHNNGKVLRGDGPPPAVGDVYFVGESESDSAAIIRGEFRREGKKAVKGAQVLKMRNGDDVTFDVDDGGRAKRKGGVKANGGSQ